MTDLEMTKLCAEAMGWRPAGERKDFDAVKAIPVEQFPGAPHYQYAPLKDDASAMALMKRFRLDVAWSWAGQVGCRSVSTASDVLENISCDHKDLNRAIVECVAKMQKASPRPQLGGDSK